MGQVLLILFAVVPPWVLFIMAWRELVAEQQQRPQLIAAQQQLWKLERYLDFTSAMVDVLAALKTQDSETIGEAYARYQVLHRSLVQLLGKVAIQEGGEFGNLLQEIIFAVSRGQWPSPQECSLLDKQGREYMQAMREVVSAPRNKRKA